MGGGGAQGALRTYAYCARADAALPAGLAQVCRDDVSHKILVS